MSIEIKKSHEGKFTEYCGGNVTSECIDKGKRSTSAKIRKLATFAANARKWKHEDGGVIFMDEGGKSRVKKFNRTYNTARIDVDEVDNRPELKQASSPVTSDDTDWDDIYSILNQQVNEPVTVATSSPSSSNSGPRGYRNFNPLNIRISNNAWAGKVSNNTDGSFEQFQNMAYGFRAGLKNMLTQIGKGKNTLRTLISSWAPDSDGNNSSSYANHVSQATGIGLDNIIDPNNKDQMTKIAHAMARIENGTDANMNDVIAGWNLLS